MSMLSAAFSYIIKPILSIAAGFYMPENVLLHGSCSITFKLVPSTCDSDHVLNMFVHVTYCPQHTW